MPKKKSPKKFVKSEKTQVGSLPIVATTAYLLLNQHDPGSILGPQTDYPDYTEVAGL